ncbi:MAG TPA: diacylglycerol kinase family protein [Actinomycetota bacterium]|nr:diacylglycerol kinase family protein [Actinomycetota bacterium]
MPRLLLVVNGAAQTVTRYARDVIAGALASEFAVDLVETKGPGHAAELAADAARARVDVVVTLGGDGTINEVVNGLAGTDVPLGVLPGGGANVFARSIGLPRDPVEATGVLLERLMEPPRPVPLGRIDDRWFHSNCGIGIDATIVRRVETRQFAKRMTGDLFFMWSAVWAYLREFDRRKAHLTVSLDGDVTENVFTLVVQNLDPFTYLGERPIRLCPEASLDLGLDSVALRTMRSTTVAGTLLRAFSGRAPSRRVAVLGHDLRRIVVTADRPVPAQVDGEYLGEREHAEIRSEPGALLLYG